MCGCVCPLEVIENSASQNATQDLFLGDELSFSKKPGSKPSFRAGAGEGFKGFIPIGE